MNLLAWMHVKRSGSRSRAPRPWPQPRGLCKAAGIHTRTGLCTSLGGWRSSPGHGCWYQQQHKDMVMKVSHWTHSKAAKGEMAPRHSQASW